MTPTIKDLTALVKAIQADISDEYRAFEDDDKPGIQLTIGANSDGDWTYQTGDNSFMGSAYHYPHWAVIGVYRDSNSRDLARELQDELADNMALAFDC